MMRGGRPLSAVLALLLAARVAGQAVPNVRDDAEDEQMTAEQLQAFNLPVPHSFEGDLIDRWNPRERRCCSPPAAPLVVDTHMHVWDEDMRPNRGFNQLGLLEDVLTESWGEGVDLGVLVQPGFRGVNNSYIVRSLERFPGTLSGEVEALKDYTNGELRQYHDVGIRGLRFKATSLAKYEELIAPRLISPQFQRIANFLRKKRWHWGVQLAASVAEKWPEILSKLQETRVPIIIDMFGRPDPLKPTGAFSGTQAILEAARRPAPAGRIWMEFGAPFRVDPRCTYADPAVADPTRCLPEHRVTIPTRSNATRTVCCPPQTHKLLIELSRLFITNIGEDYIVWGTDWPFISDVGVTVGGLLDAMAAWVPDLPQRQRILGVNAVRPNAVFEEPLFPLIDRVTRAERESVGEAQQDILLDVAVRQPIPVQDSLEDEPQNPEGAEGAPAPPQFPPKGGLVQRWKPEEKRCCSSPLAPVVVDTHAHVWDEDPRPNRGFNQLGLLEDVLVEGWGVGVHLAVLVQPGFRLENNTYIERSLEQLPGRLAGEVEHVVDYDDATLRRYHALGIRGLRFKATSLTKYAALVEPRLVSPEFQRIVNFMRAHDWHWGVQLSKEVGTKWQEILAKLQATQLPVMVDMFGRPDPTAAVDIGTQAIVEAARRPAPAGKIWMELGGPFRVDPRCTYAEPAAADPTRCLPGDRVNITRRGEGTSRPLCCPPRTHELFISLARLFAAAIGPDHLVWGTDWPFISDTGVTTRGLLDAVASWLQPDDKLLYKVLGGNALRPNAVGNSPLFPLLDLRKRPPLRIAGVFSMRREDDARAFLHAADEANTLLSLPVLLDAVVYWQNDTDNTLEYFQTACSVVEDGAFAVVGPPSSTQTAAMQNIFSPLGVPVMGTSASDPTLARFPNFLRLVPGDNQQSLALAAVMKHFQWLRVATVYQMDSYGENGLEAFWSWSLQANGDVLRIPVPLRANDFEMTALLETIKTKRYNVIIANICCDLAFIGRLTAAANGLGLFDEGRFWLFTDGVTSFMDTGELGQVMPAVGQKPGLFGVVVDVQVDPLFEGQLARRFPERAGNVSIFTATAYDAVFALARAAETLPEESFKILGQPQTCLRPGETAPAGRMLAGVISDARRAASEEALRALRAVRFQGVSGEVVFDGQGGRTDQRFKVLNVREGGAVAHMGHVAADGSSLLTVEPNFVPLFLGPTQLQPSDAPAREMAGLGVFGAMVVVLIPVTLLLGCWCELLQRLGRGLEQTEADAADTESGKLSSAGDDGASTPTPAQRIEEGLCGPPCCSRPFSRLAARVLPFMQAYLGGFEPSPGCPPPTMRRPIVGDFIAGGVKSIVELVGCLTFAALMSPDELQPFLPVFLNYALFGFIVSQIYYNLVSNYTTPARTCNISAVIFFLEVLAQARIDLAGLPNQAEVTVNTMLMAATITTWMSGALLWFVGTFKFTHFVRYLSEPVKLGMQVSLGYFLFATGFSISTGISWLNFTTLGEFGIYFQLDTLPKWTLTTACAGSIFYALNKWGWPYTIPAFVGVGVGIFHVILAIGGFSIEQAKDSGWLYPPPAGAGDGGYNPFAFIGRIYSIDAISWRTLRFQLPQIATAAVVSPFLSAIINLILFETTFPAEEFGKSTLSYELRMDGMVQWLLSFVGGYSTSPSCGGTAVHRKIGARSNWGLFSSCLVHSAFLLVPGSTDVLQYVPKYVVGAVSLIVAISLLDSGLRGGYSKLSKQEYAVVCLTLVMSMFFGIERGIAGGAILSFALFIRDVASTVPIKLDVDAGLVSSHAVFGARSARVVAQVRGAIRLLSFQGVLFFAAAQPTLKAAEKKHLNGDKAFFLILDFSSVTGMDDSTPFEFRNFVNAARKVGVSIVISGCDHGLLKKLRKVGAVPEGGGSVVVADGEDMVPAAQKAAAAGGLDGCALYVLGSADRAVEFCETALAMRTLDLCKEVVPKPSRELEALSNLLEGDLKRYGRRLIKGEMLERKEGEIFVIVEGAIEAVAQLTDASSGAETQPEVIVVYRTLPGLEKDYCFGASTPGVLRAASDSVVVTLPEATMSELRNSGRWEDVQVVWGQLAEFMASSMHPMAMKATMQDVRGSFSSGAAQAFAEAVLEHQQAEGRSPVSDAGSVQNQKNFFRRLFLGGGARLRALRQTITVTAEGRRPAFGGVGDGEASGKAPRPSLTRALSRKSGEFYTPLKESEKAPPLARSATVDLPSSSSPAIQMQQRPLSRSASASPIGGKTLGGADVSPQSIGRARSSSVGDAGVKEEGSEISSSGGLLATVEEAVAAVTTSAEPAPAAGAAAPADASVEADPTEEGRSASKKALRSQLKLARSRSNIGLEAL